MTKPQQQKQDYKKKEYPHSLTLEASHKKVGSKYQVSAVARAKDGKYPLRHGEVTFYLSGVDPPGVGDLDGTGVARCTFFVDAGEYELFARLPGGEESSKIPLDLKDPPKKVGRVSLEVTGIGGKYTLTIRTLTSEGKPVPDTPITFIQESGLDSPVSLIANQFGVATHVVNFTESRRVYFAETGGIESERKTLLGPLPKP